MANLNNLFEKFNSNITLTSTKRNSLQTSRNALRKDIKQWFSDNDKKQPRFCWQGSFAMKTVNNALDGKEYDLDDGVYLQGYEDTEMEDWVAVSTVHSWIKDAVKNRTIANVVDKDTCIRVPYASGYHIDIPIYICKDDVAYLAHKKKGWLESDPKAFKDWFIGKITSDEYGEQLRRVVKYLKAWRDYKGIPLKGVEITILAVNNFDKYDERDDKCLKNTVEKIINSLESDFKCTKPVRPFEDLFEGVSQTKETLILSGFKTLKSNLTDAIAESDEKKASEKMRTSFGTRFPLGKASENDSFASSVRPGVLRNDGRSA